MATTNLNIRVDADLKHQAESIFNELGMNLSTAMNLFLRSTVRFGGIPFDLRLNQNTKTIAEFKAEVIKKLEESNEDIAAGRVMDAYESLRLLREKHGL